MNEKKLNITSWKQYKKEAFKTWNHSIKGDNALEYIECKIIEELGELLGAYAKEKFHGKKPNYLEELGDLCFYLANLENITNGIDYFDRVNDHFYENFGHHTKIIIGRFLSIGELVYAVIPLYKYIDVACKNLEINIKDVWTFNIKKLRKRHGESYNKSHYQSKC